MPGDEQITPTKLFTEVRDEMRDLRGENTQAHRDIVAMLSKRNELQDRRMNGLEARTRSLEVWRGWILGLGAVIATGAAWLVSRVTGR